MTILIEVINNFELKNGELAIELLEAEVRMNTNSKLRFHILSGSIVDPIFENEKDKKRFTKYVNKFIKLFSYLKSKK